MDGSALALHKAIKQAQLLGRRVVKGAKIGKNLVIIMHQAVFLAEIVEKAAQVLGVGTRNFVSQTVGARVAFLQAGEQAIELGVEVIRGCPRAA